jgi:16S rRNA (cytidine1402-2'-O)-methyltransferase
MAGTLFVVATPIGNLEDITARALRVLRSVAIIAAEDTRRTAGLLAHFGIATPMVSLHEHNEAARAPRLVERLRSGEDVAVVSDAGTPTVSDPGQRLVHAAVQAGIRVEPIPGPSAILTAIAASGFEGDGFTFLGFPPVGSKARSSWFQKIRSIEGIVVFFEAPHRIKSTLDELSAVVGSETPVLVGRELTKVHEELVRGPIIEVAKRLDSPRGEFTVVALVGQSTESSTLEPAAGIDWLREIGEITKSMGLSKRRAIGVLAKRTGVAPNEVYDRIEQAKKSVK